MFRSLSLMRRALVLAAIALPIAGNALAIAIDKEIFPFSPYHMYARLEGDQASLVRAYAVEPNGAERPLPSEVEPSRARLGGIVARERDAPDERARLDHLAGLLACVHEALRERGDVVGPAVGRVRIYRLHWRVEHDLVNLGSPDRELLGEGSCR